MSEAAKASAQRSRKPVPTLAVGAGLGQRQTQPDSGKYIPERYDQQLRLLAAAMDTSIKPGLEVDATASNALGGDGVDASISASSFIAASTTASPLLAMRMQRPVSAGGGGSRPHLTLARPMSAAAEVTPHVDEPSLRRVQSASALRREQRRAASVASAVLAARPSSAASKGSAAAKAEAAALRAAAYQPHTVESVVPLELRTTNRLPIYTGHLLPPSDRDGAFDFHFRKPSSPKPGGGGPRDYEAAFWQQQEYPTHSTLSRREQPDHLAGAPPVLSECCRPS